MRRNFWLSLIEQVFMTCSIIFFYSCSNNQLENSFVREYDKNIIIIIDGNNNLNKYSDALVENLKKPYIKYPSTQITLIYNTKNKLKIYDLYRNDSILLPKENFYSANGLQKYLKKYTSMFHVRENILILWSHGTGWINSTRSFGDDGGNNINIYELAKILPIKFDCIVFDACYMSCIENLFELREKTRYVLSSPNVVPVDGIIDNNTLNLLCKSNDIKEKLISICNYYKKKHSNNSINISLALTETSCLQKIAMQIANSDIKIQKNETYNLNNFMFRNYKIFYDIKEVVSKTELQNLNIDFNKLIVYNVNGINNTFISSGVSIFVPTNNEIYYNSYSKTSWEKYTNWLKKFE